ncbi:MAG: hypothetical protein ACJAZ3_000056 [Sphingobacteriales bacterium]|jgi:hypothetical protein
MPNIKSIVFLVAMVVTTFNSGCNWLENRGNEEKGDPVARVGSKYLYEADLESMIVDGTSERDSALIVQGYINSWITDQLMVLKAEENLTIDSRALDNKILSYKNSLITYLYQQQLVNQKLDTAIHDTVLFQYYKSNIESFKLKEPVIRGSFIVLPKNSPELWKVRRWMLSSKEEDQLNLEDYCVTFSPKYLINDTTWQSVKNFALLIDKGVEENAISIKNKSIQKININDNLAYIFINDFRTKDSESPFQLERQTIRSILLNKRKLELTKKIEQDVRAEGLKNNKFEIIK